MRSLLLLPLVACLSASAREQPAAPVLEFRIVANTEDEEKALDMAAKYLTTARDELKKRAEKGEPPPAPADLKSDKAPGYGWARLGTTALRDLDLDDAAEKDENRGERWRQAAEARRKGEAFVLKRFDKGVLVFSRPSAMADRKVEYFLLLRTMPAGQAVGPQHFERVAAGTNFNEMPCVDLTLNEEGGDRLHAVTDGNTDRHLAIVYQGEVYSAPVIKSAVRNRVQISGDFTKQDVEKMVAVLQAARKPG